MYDNVRWGTRVSTYVPRSVHGALNIRQASERRTATGYNRIPDKQVRQHYDWEWEQ